MCLVVLLPPLQKPDHRSLAATGNGQHDLACYGVAGKEVAEGVKVFVTGLAGLRSDRL